MYDAVFVPTPKYVPTKWETTDIGEFVQYDPKFFEVRQIPDKQRMGLVCVRAKGKIPQPVGLTDYSYMFADTRIGSVDMTGWDFSKICDMSSFFKNCNKLDKVKCDNLNLKMCSDFNRMFYNCDSLKRINVETWQLDELSDCAEMFAECSNLVLCLISGWHTRKLDTTTAMFENCRELRSIDCSGWFTPDLNAVNRMFKGCSKLKFANVEFTNVKGLADMDRMFMDCSSLKNVNLPNISEMPGVTLYLTFDGTPLSVWPQEYKDFMEKRRSEKKGDEDWY